MKAKELRDLTAEEILKRKKELKEEVFNLRFRTPPDSSTIRLA